MRYIGRSFLIFSFFTTLLVIILIYICILQTFFYHYFFNRSTNNYTRFEKIETLRGIISDENNIPIAYTQPIIKLLWNKYPLQLSEEDQQVLSFIEEIYQEKIDLNSLESIENTIILKNAISFEKLSLLLENFPHSRRIKFLHELQRHYPHKNLFCHVIGYINKEKNPLFGLEKRYNDLLIGKNGLIQNTINARGKIINHNFLELPEEGRKINTTLNFYLQKGIAEVFPPNESGCAIIVDPLTGAIKALYSAPTFNPELFQDTIDQKEWKNLVDKKALINRAFQAQYPPGSIYKLLIALILLEENIIKEGTQWFCNGHIEYKGRKYHCNRKNGHGLVTISDGLSHSCNIPFFSSAIENISVDTIYKHANLFELGKKTGLFENELSGIIPSKTWKKKKFGSAWYGGENLSIVIGQGATTLTPIQLTQIIMGIMHGHIIKPYILTDQKSEKIILPYKKENLQIIKNNMKLGTKKGSSRILASLNNWEIYAKTGTVQVCSLEKIENNTSLLEDKNFHHHGLFACWAKYQNEKPMILVFVIENNGSSRYTVEIVKNFLLYCEREIYKKK